MAMTACYTLDSITVASGFAAQTWDIAGNETNFFRSSLVMLTCFPRLFRLRGRSSSWLSQTR
jgi:hypothetical protein